MTRSALLGGILATPLFAQAALAQSSTGLEPLAQATGWLGTPMSAQSLRGRVVLLDVFTFECINCVNVTPNLERLYRAYPRSELAIVAVHTPEVPSYQSRMAYLAQQKRKAEIPWPIAVDNRFAIWNAYGVSAWPTQLFFDRAGRLRRTVVGDGSDELVAGIVHDLVAHG